ncbi:MAG: methyltransferase domain-containing protein [Alphaproteobacteria bacterium]|nr:methyltransferase domain-containing protein [Alphaproteobacteria bacterium]
MDVYEKPGILSEYLTFHYGTEAELLPYPFGPKAALDFPARCIQDLLVPPSSTGGGDGYELAYDLGCAVGRSTFELARHARSVCGFDLSSSFIGAANQMLDQGRIETDIVIEGEMIERIELRAPALEATGDIRFQVGDAVELAAALPPADVVLAANLVCRLPTPKHFLSSMSRLIKPSGQLLLVTPFTWLEAFTPPSAWPRHGDGTPMSSAAWIEDILGDEFVLEHSEDLPFLIREHVRKFQWAVSLGMRWRRRA